MAVCRRADPLDVVVVALLRQADLGLEAQHLLAVFAELAVHQVLAVQNFVHAVDEGLEHQRMVVEIGRLDEFDVGMARRDRVGGVVDALHQNAGEEEIREDDDAAEAELRRLLQRRLDEREGDAGIGGLRPAEAKPLPEHARDLGDVGIGVGIGGAAADDDEQRFVQRDIARRRVERLADAVAGGAEHFRVEPELAAVFDLQARAGRPGRC